MKLKLALFLPILALPVGHLNTLPKEQTHFCVECPVERPVPLPAMVLETLRVTKDQNIDQDDWERCAQGEGISRSDIPESWFVASQLTLKKGESPGLVVQTKNACFYGAHIGPFWLLEGSQAGYRLAFAGRADGFEVLRHHTNGYPDIELVFFFEAGKFLEYSKFCYEDGKYRFCGKRTERNAT